MGVQTVAATRVYVAKETIPGTSVPPVAEVLPSDLVNINVIPTHVMDGNMTGKTPGEKVLVQALVQGNFNAITRLNDRGSDIYLAFLFGNVMDAPVGIGAGFAFWYTGAQNSAKITFNNVSNTLTSYIGDLGAEIADTNFKSDVTDGEISFADITADTLSEAIALINGLTDYTAIKLAGPDAYDLSVNAVLEIGRTIQQGKNAWVEVWFTGTTAYIKRISILDPEAAINTLSVQIEGRDNTDKRYTGITPLTGTMSGAIGALVTTTGTVHGFNVETNPTPASVPAVKSGNYKFWNREFHVNGESFLCVRNITVTVNSNTTPEYCAPGPYANGNFRDRYTVNITFDIQEGAAGEALKQAALDNDWAQFRWLLYGSPIDADTNGMIILKGWGQFEDAPPVANVNVIDRSVIMDLTEQTDNYNEQWEMYILTTDNNTW